MHVHGALIRLSSVVCIYGKDQVEENKGMDRVGLGFA